MKLSLKNTKAELFDAVQKSESVKEQRNFLIYTLVVVWVWAVLF